MRIATFSIAVHPVVTRMMRTSTKGHVRITWLAGARVEERMTRARLTRYCKAAHRHSRSPGLVKVTCGARSVCGKASSATERRWNLASVLPTRAHGKVLEMTCRPPSASSEDGGMESPRRCAMDAVVISDADMLRGTDANVGARDAPTVELEDANAAE